MDLNKWEDFSGFLNVLFKFDRLDKKNKDFILDLMERMKKYDELIMAVESAYDGESRHETALRYIKTYESNKCLCANGANYDKQDGEK